jgi:hypothetical protein
MGSTESFLDNESARTFTLVNFGKGGEQHANENDD